MPESSTRGSIVRQGVVCWRAILSLGTALLIASCTSTAISDTTLGIATWNKLSYGQYSGDSVPGIGVTPVAYVNSYWSSPHGFATVKQTTMITKTLISPPPYIWIEETSTSEICHNGQMVSDGTNASSTVGPVNQSGVCERWCRVKVPTSCEISRTGTVGSSADIDYPGYEDWISVTATYDWNAYSTYGGGKPIPSRTYVAPRGRGHAPMYHQGQDPVDLATGQDTFAPGPDIAAYNPYGPAAVHAIECSTLRAEQGYASPGLTVGWTDGYDVKMEPANPATWSNLTITYSNGATEVFTPNLDNGQPDGTFVVPSGSAYYVTGTASSTTGEWQSITMTYRDQSSWTFTEAASDVYMLSRIANRMGRCISIQRDSGNGYRVSSVVDDSTPTAQTLLTYAYTDGHLSSVTDAYGRKVTYAYAQKAGATCLVDVSQIGPSSAATLPSQHAYDYTAVVGTGQSAQPHLSSITTPSPTGSGTSVQHVNYNDDGQVESLVDANGNTTEFSYESYDGTAVQVKNAQGTVQSAWKANFDSANNNIETGATDAAGYSTVTEYGDSRFEDKPTTLTDKAGLATQIAYDSHGNVVSVENPRGTTTVYTYSYTAFPLGRLMSVAEGDRPETSFTYYEPSGLLHTITSPKPGTTGGSETVTISYTYDSLGNVLTKTVPGNADNVQSITTTFDYGSNPKLGQPLSVVDALNHTTHFTYDDRGNITQTQDALGHTTDLTYNIADQLSTVVQPAVP